MQRVPRSRMSANDKTAIWDRWARGESLSEIGRAVARIPAAVFHVVRARGGIPPPARWRSCQALTVREREEISRGLATGVSFRQLGVQLGRPTSTVSREVGRHGGTGGVSRRCGGRHHMAPGATASTLRYSAAYLHSAVPCRSR